MSDEPSLVLFGFCRKAVLAGMSASRRAMWNRDFEGGHNARIGVRTTEGWNVEWRVRTMDEVKPEAPSRQISLGLCYASRRRSSIGRADKKPCSRRLIITERRGLMKPDRESWVAEGGSITPGFIGRHRNLGGHQCVINLGLPTLTPRTRYYSYRPGRPPCSRQR